MTLPGSQLEELCRTGRETILLVAPFIKAATLERLLAHLAPTVALRCVTRWRPEEIAAGVSDLAVWPLLCGRPHSSLWLSSALHAKYYRADERCLVGSANLTNTALGWSAQPNLELLVELPAQAAACVNFEQTLWASTVAVEADLYTLMAEAVALLPPALPPLLLAEAPAPYAITPVPPVLPPGVWLPTLRHPEDLWLAYSGRSAVLSEVAVANARADLLALPTLPGLSRDAFGRSIGVLLLQQPSVRQIDQMLKQPQRFGAVRDALARLPCAAAPDFNPTQAWQTLMRWLLHFLPARYVRLPSRHSEVLVRTSGAHANEGQG